MTGVLLLLLVFTWVAGLFIDLTGDAGLYAAISRQMVESGDWLNLKIHGVPYDQKPHLLFWLAGAGISLFGNSNFAFKLFPFLFGLSGIFFTYRLAKIVFSEAAGKVAAAFTATSQMFFLYFFDIHTDTVMQAAVMLALWQLAAWFKHRKPVHFIAGFLGAGLAMFAKGPVGAVVPFLFVAFYLVLRKENKEIFNPRWLAGILIALLVISPTLYHLWENFGWDGLRFYFIDNNIGRVSGKVAGTSTDPFFYLYNLLWALLPWTVPVLAGVVLEIRSWFSNKPVNTESASLLGGVLVMFLMFSIARGKAPNYIMPLIPPMAVIASGNLLRFTTVDSASKKILTILHQLLLVLMCLLLVGTGLLISHNWLFIIIVGAFSGLLAVVICRKESNRLKRLMYLSVLVGGIFNLFLNAKVAPELFGYQGARQAVIIYENDKSQNKKLYNWDLEEYELFFMAENRVKNIVSWEQMHTVMETPASWLYTNEGKHNEIIKMGFPIDTVYRIEQRGMNRISLEFLNPESRAESLNPHYLIKTNDNFE